MSDTGKFHHRTSTNLGRYKIRVRRTRNQQTPNRLRGRPPIWGPPIWGLIGSNWAEKFKNVLVLPPAGPVFLKFVRSVDPRTQS